MRHSPGRGIVAQRVRMNRFGDAGFLGGIPAGYEDGFGGDGPIGFRAGEEPLFRVLPPEVDSQQLQ